MKYEKKYVFLIATVLMVYLVCTIFFPNKRKSIITTKVTILEKNFEADFHYITVPDPIDPHSNPIVIQVKNENVWNLIIKGKDYLITYNATDKNDCYLIQIKYLDSFTKE